MKRLVLAALLLGAQGCAHKPPVDAYLSDLNDRLEIAESRIQSLTESQQAAGIWKQSRADSILESEDDQPGQPAIAAEGWRQWQEEREAREWTEAYMRFGACDTCKGWIAWRDSVLESDFLKGVHQ